MKKRRFPLLCEDRLTRILRKGGMLVLSGGCWRIYRARDLRGSCVGHALPMLVERLEAEGLVGADPKAEQRRIWTGPKLEREQQLRILPRPVIANSKRRQQPRKSLLERAIGMEPDDGMRVRLAAAANRYLADIEQAATPQSLTMQWNDVRVDGGRRGAGHAGPSGRASAAAVRLLKVNGVLGERAVNILDMMLLRRASVASLSRHYEISREAAIEVAHAALQSLATVYALNVRAV